MEVSNALFKRYYMIWFGSGYSVNPVVCVIILIYIFLYVHRFSQVPEFNNKTFNSVSIYGLGSERPSQITKNNGSTTVIDESQWHFDLDLGYLKVVDIALNLCDSINWIY